MKNPLKGFTIASTGDFGKRRTAEAIKRWVENNGGRYVTKIDDEVTHLVCSAECWKSQSAMGESQYPCLNVICRSLVGAKRENLRPSCFLSGSL